MGGLFDEDAQKEFLDEGSEPAGTAGGTRRLNVRLPRPDAAPTPTPAQPSPAAPQPDVAVDDTSETAEEPDSPAVAQGRERQQDVVIRLSDPVVRALIAARNQQPGLTTTDVVLDAVDRAWPDLDRIVPPVPARTSPLPPRTRHRRPGGTRGQRVHLRLTPSERAPLEELVETTTAGSLTDLIERVLRHTLDIGDEIAK